MRKIFKTLDRYLAGELCLTGLAVLLVLLLVVMGAEIAYWLAAVVEGRIQVDVLLPLLSISAVRYTIVLLPLSTLLTVLLVFGRLYRDSEMAAIMSAGCGPLCWYRPVLTVALPVSLALMILTLWVMPELNAYKQRLLNEAGNRQDLDTLSAGRFNRAANDDAVFFIESRSAEHNRVRGVFLQHRVEQTDTVNIAGEAKSVRNINGDVYLELLAGRQYIGNAGSRNYRIISYERYGVRLPDQPVGRVVRKIKSLPTGQLMASSRTDYLAELHWRLTMPVGLLLLALLAVPLSYTRPRSGRFAKLAVALVLYLVYSNLLGISISWMREGVIPVWLAGWWVHAVALLLLLALFWQQGYFRRRQESRRAA